MRLKLDFNGKTILLLLIFSSTLFSYEVLTTRKDIKFKEKITKENLVLKQVDTLSKNCTPLSLQELDNGVFTASHYIFKDSILCSNDVVKYEKESVIFDFGSLQIEHEGKIIYENDQYIRIKKQDGTIEKIYKNGKIE
ncbi:MAG: hypothetical protein WCY75_09665 [Sulfurimonadaceae bacterium]|nr:hypothetical protein [Arcobacteraceae bacterium]